jgi:hypothetical protein
LSTPSTEQLQRAIPRSGNGAPPRAHNQRGRILALLRERGPAGVLGSELYDSPELYGRSPRNRISELWRDGHLISGEARGASDWHYILVRENESPTSRGPQGKAAEQASLSQDWYTRTTGEARPGVAPESLFLWERRQ